MVTLVTVCLMIVSGFTWGELALPKNPHPPVLLVATVNQTTPMLGEPIVYTVLEYRTRIAPNYASIEAPKLATESITVISYPLPDHPSIQYRGNSRYYVYKRVHQKLIPQQSGHMIIPSAIGYAERTHIANPIVMHVQPQPSSPVTQPASVGRFALEAPQIPPTVVANEPMVVPIVVHATGNFTTQSIQFGRSHIFRHYLDSHTIESTADPTVQTHRLTYIFIPNRPGEFPLPAIQLWTLNPTTRQYHWLEAPKRYVTVYDETSPAAAVILNQQSAQSIPTLWKQLQRNPRNSNHRARWAAVIQHHPDQPFFIQMPRGLGRYEWLALLLLSAGLAGIAYAYQRHRLLLLWVGIHGSIWIAYFTLYPYPIVLLEADRTGFYTHKDDPSPRFMLHQDLPVYYQKSSGNWWKIQLGTGQEGWIQP